VRALLVSRRFSARPASPQSGNLEVSFTGDVQTYHHCSNIDHYRLTGRMEYVRAPGDRRAGRPASRRHRAAENATASNKRSRRTARWHGLTNPGGRQISGTRPLTPRNAVHGMSGLSGLNASIAAEAGSRNSSPRRKGTYGIYQTSRRSSARPGRVGTAARVAGTAEQPWVAGGRVHA